MDIPTCATCRHWRPGEWLAFNVHAEGQRLGECCVNDGLPDGSGPSSVATCNSEGIYGELVTDPRFGCNRHKPRLLEPGEPGSEAAS